MWAGITSLHAEGWSMEKTQKNIYLGVGLAVVFGMILFFVIPKAIVVPSNIKVISLRPDFWPGMLCVAIIVISFCLVLVSCYENWVSTKSRERSVKSVAKIATPSSAIVKPLVVIIGLLVYYYAVEPLGIIIS